MRALISVNFSKGGFAFLLISVFAVLVISLPVYAGGNNFFGGNAGGGNSGSNSTNSNDVDETNVNSGLPGLISPPAKPPSGDYTDDEKRVQRKFKDNIAHAKGLIEKGEAMMKSGSKEDKLYKRGQILKETGLKWLTQLKDNDPYASGKDNAVKSSGTK